VNETLVNILGKFSPLLGGMGRRSASAIFMFHRVIPEGEICYDPEMATSKELFEAFLDWADERYRVVSLVDLLSARPKQGDGKKPFCAITFDDGWQDVFLHAFPLLRAREMPATIFLPVRFVGTVRRFWQERIWFFSRELRRRNQPESVVDHLMARFPWYPPLPAQGLDFKPLRRTLLERPSQEAEEFADCLEEVLGPGAVPPGPAFMDWTQVRAMRSAGITFGSHTLNHTLLICSDPKTARREIEDSRTELEGILGEPTAGFSYPWGASDPRLREQVRKAGYAFAVATDTNLIPEAADPYALPRLAVSSAFLRGRNGKFEPNRVNFYLFRAAIPLGKPKRASPVNSSGRERIRIAFVIDFIDAWEDGGTEKQLAQLISALDRDYFEPELYFLRPSLGLTDKDFPCPVRVASPLPAPKWSRVGVLYRLAQLFRRHRPHIVQTFFRDGTYYGVAAAKFARVPIVVVSRRNAGHWITRVDRLALKMINRQVDSWQCNSRAAFESLTSAESVPAEQIEILSNALDVDRFSPATEEEKSSIRKCLGLPDSSLVAVSVANLTPVKDTSTLVDAAAMLVGALPDARFLLVGDGPLRAPLEERARQRGLSESVKFAGTQSDVRPFLAAADIGVLTSKSEGSSNSLLEYMAMGLPIVASAIPANRELVEGFFFETGNPRDLADKLLALWSDPKRRDLMRQGNRQRALEYSPQRFAERAQSYYSKLVAKYSQGS